VRASTVDTLQHLGLHVLLIALAQDPDPQVRLEYAKLTPWRPNLHNHLVTDPDVIVRGCIADHTELPAPAALTLARNASDDVRERVARRDGLSKSVLEVLLSDPNPEVRRALAYAKVDDAPAWVLERLSSDADKDVRWQVAYNWRTPKRILRQLEVDEDENVRSAARYTLTQL
jgi:hypothetical protein